MATPVGTDVVTSLARRYIIPEIIDTVYGRNPVWYRLNQSNKKMIQGGYHIEVPFMHSRFSNGGPYQGFDLLDVAPNDTVLNGAWDWKQHFVPVTVDGLTMIKTDSPKAIANHIRMYFQQAELEMAENLADGLWSDGSNSKEIDGLETVVDDGSVAATYAGLTRSSYDFLDAQIDSSSSSLSESVLQTMHTNVGVGGRQATLICSRKEQYNRYVELLRDQKRFMYQPGGHDTMLADAGFTNLLYNGTPWVVDDHVFDGPNTSNSAIVFLNEDYLHWCVSPKSDFYLVPFQMPVNQDAMTSRLQWAGNLICTLPARQGALTNISS